MKDNQNILEQFMKIDGREGLEEEIFIAVSTIIPIVNVDLLILDSQNHILLSWRDDVYFGKGWHIPGTGKPFFCQYNFYQRLCYHCQTNHQRPHHIGTDLYRPSGHLFHSDSVLLKS